MITETLESHAIPFADYRAQDYDNAQARQANAMVHKQ